MNKDTYTMSVEATDNTTKRFLNVISHSRGKNYLSINESYMNEKGEYIQATHIIDTHIIKVVSSYHIARG